MTAASTRVRSYSFTCVTRPRAERGSSPAASGCRPPPSTSAGTSTTSSPSRKGTAEPLRVLTITSAGRREVRPAMTRSATPS